MSIVCKRGHQVPAGSKFCLECGEPILESRPVSAFSPLENQFEPLQSGMCLHERYIIQEQLGQGGFGITYLAEDIGRFHEKFVIKEFMPLMRNTAALKKAEELFRREAAILHQLEHRQIPRFWEIFRQEKRIFLVVDYVEGANYKHLLEQRLQQDQCFTETEILELFQKLLPVLSYLHQRGVVHRDISPDNIVLRIQDNLPVLIDLGGVKQVAMEVSTLTQTEEYPSSVLTCLGKVGYAPEEQISLGLVAPHSDLYALAVSSLVLMTGKKPQQLLLRNTQQQCFWEQDLKLHPLLTRTISRMLAQKPADRFQSADEVLQVLRSIFPSAHSQEQSRQSTISPLRSGVPHPNQPSNGSQHRPTFLKKNWRDLSVTVKFLVPALLVIASGLIYFFWKNDSILSPQPTLPDISRISDLQLRNSMRDVENVPSGLLNYGGAHTFAALTAHGMNDSITKAHSEFRLRYTDPFNAEPGSGTGIAMLLKGELSFAQSARPLEENDHSKAKTLGFSLEQVPVAIDGVAFYTHLNLNIPGLSINQLQAIFKGQVTNWQQVGGPNLPIVAVALNPKITSVLKLLLGGEGENLSPKVQIVRDYTEAIRKVASTPGGISYGSAPAYCSAENHPSPGIS